MCPQTLRLTTTTQGRRYIGRYQETGVGSIPTPATREGTKVSILILSPTISETIMANVASYLLITGLVFVYVTTREATTKLVERMIR